jgi:serine/threonine-protein kinase
VSTSRISLPDRYRVIRHIANGGMASVWEAQDELLARPVAVKLLASHLSEDDRARQRFQREARAAAAVSNHPNVVTIYDVGEHDGRTFMVMECLTGGTVADKLRSGERIDPRTAMQWLHDAASALDAAHAADVVHREAESATASRCAGWRRPARRSTPRTRPGSCTATSSRRTCCSTTPGASRSPTSGSPGSRSRTS